uniref:Uncharacterized protein n=1 Tax=Arundo donax TaxID=35708 RepID=A0A0A9FU36_ARUDO
MILRGLFAKFTIFLILM